MSSFVSHIGWLSKTNQVIHTKDGMPIEIWELEHKQDPKVLSQWAKHFRNHYCEDGQLDTLISGTPYTRADYLLKIKFPDKSQAPGPSIRSGDFAEILVADYIEYMLKYWVPRTRYDDKTVRNESKKGSDILGFRFQQVDRPSPEDTLIIFETKAQLSKTVARAVLQEAISDSAKDELRKAESLNAIKQRLIDKGRLTEAQRIARFQSPEDKPYNILFGAAALITTESLDEAELKSSVADGHPHRGKLSLLVIKGSELMELVHQLYETAANEA